MTMDLALNTTVNYWNMLKSLSSDVKLELIARLSSSLTRAKASAKPVTASRFYGIWNDDDFDMNAEEMNAEIRASHRFKDDIEAF